ncbi:unnamed protein product, partial [Closterium sp. NIES-54]
MRHALCPCKLSKLPSFLRPLPLTLSLFCPIFPSSRMPPYPRLFLCMTHSKPTATPPATFSPFPSFSSTLPTLSPSIPTLSTIPTFPTLLTFPILPSSSHPHPSSASHSIPSFPSALPHFLSSNVP